MGYTHGHRWTEGEVESRIAEVMGFYGLDRMPTRSECDSYFGETSLSCRISKTCGWYALADRLGLPLKEGETTMGKRWELAAAEMLASMGHDVVRMTQNHPYDLLINGCVRADAKAGRLYRGQGNVYYPFYLGKKYGTCDIYILFAVADDGSFVPYIVPAVEVMGQSQIAIGVVTSKYDRYREGWELIQKYADMVMSFKA